MGRRRESESEQSGSGEARRKLPQVSPWRKLLLAVSAVVALGGLGLWAYAATTAPEPASSPSTTSTAPGEFTPSGLAPLDPRPSDGTGDAGAQPEPSQLEVWSPAIFRLGFSCFAGFCMAYALRAFMKITIVVTGIALLGLFGLQYAGLINVDWGAMEGVYNTVTAWVRQQTGSFAEFVSGYLPSAASGAAGFAAGFTTRK
jgi:uncharacterized membrane protein (Fun14 family)